MGNMVPTAWGWESLLPSPPSPSDSGDLWRSLGPLLCGEVTLAISPTSGGPTLNCVINAWDGELRGPLE